MRTDKQAHQALAKEIKRVSKQFSKSTGNHWHSGYIEGMNDVAVGFKQMDDNSQEKRLEITGYMTGLWHGLCAFFGLDPLLAREGIKHSPPPTFPTHKDRSPTVKRPKKQAKRK